MTSNDHNDNSKEEQLQPMDNLQRLTRVIQPPSHYIPSCEGKSYIQVDVQQGMSYLQQEAKVIAMIMCQFNKRIDIKKLQHGAQFIVTYSLKQGIQELGEEAQKSALKEMIFSPSKKSHYQKQKKRALESLIFQLNRETKPSSLNIEPIVLLNETT